MSLADRLELENTRQKLAKLESFHRETQQRPMPSEHVRELTLRSIRKRMNQLNEEIARFEAGAVSRPAAIENECQLENTRKKVKSMEDLYARTAARPSANEYARDLTLRSLRKRINQFKEEMIRFEAAVARS